MPGAGLPYQLLEATVRKMATEMEDWAFLQLAYTTLAATSALLPDALIVERGRIISQRARVARQLGATTAAALYHDEVARLGLEHDAAELTALADGGHGSLALLAGNYPAARRRFLNVLALADAPVRSRAMAHSGLMFCAATREDYDAAAHHAWEAYTGTPDTVEQIDLLVNLSHVLLLAGHPQAALRGFSAVLGRHSHPRAALPAFGGAALAAVGARGVVSGRGVVRFAAARIEALVANLGGGAVPMLAFPCASALVEVSEALHVVGEDDWAARCAHAGSRIAARNGFHHLTHRLEKPWPTVQSVPVTPTRRVIVEQVEALKGAELVGV